MQMEQNNDIESRILEAAAKVFIDKGYEGTNMTLIAEAAGIGRPALYYYYRTKDKIFGEIFGNLIKSFVPEILGIIQKDAPVEQRIEELVDAYFKQLMKNPKLPLFIAKEIDRDPQLIVSTASKIHIESFFVSIYQAYNNEIKAGHIKNTPAYAIILNIVSGVITPFLFSPLFKTLTESSGIGESGVPQGFSALIEAWKPYVIRNMENLLVP